jgi:iron-sulfur cluster repair protein YtfE (RIC family)
MLMQLGKPAPAGDAVDLLLECHARIRAFLDLARRIADAIEADDATLSDAAARVHRYFTEALPLHAEDEERSILPRLRGLDAQIDAELLEMSREHSEHAGPLGALVDACRALAADPGRHAEVAPAIAAAARALEEHFVRHLRREEDVIFPAVRRLLDAAADAAIVREIRARRAAASGRTA